jgi:hypothetical protein
MVETKIKTISEHIVSVKVTTVVAVAVVAVSFLISLGIGYEKIQARLRHLDAKTDVYSERFDELRGRVDKNDIQFAEIQKDIKGIETILVEIKRKL